MGWDGRGDKKSKETTFLRWVVKKVDFIFLLRRRLFYCIAKQVALERNATIYRGRTKQVFTPWTDQIDHDLDHPVLHLPL